MKLLVLSLVACAAFAAQAQVQAPWPNSPPAGRQARVVTPAMTPAPATNVPAPGFVNGYAPDETYELRAGDTVSFQILEDRIWDPSNAPVSLTVEDSGDIDVPYVGLVMAAGKTCKQLTAQIKTALEKDYYKEATVVLSLKLANPILGQVYVSGMVLKPGPEDIMLNQNLTASQAILLAGGFADFANRQKVKVIRGGAGADGETNSFNLDMTQIIDQGKVGEDIVLKPGDMVIVPSRLVNF